MKKLILLTLLGLSQFIIAQNTGTVTGLIRDKEMNNEPLPFANVYIKNTSIGGTTEMDGTFSFKVPAGKQIIVISFVGYKTIEKPIIVVANKTITVNETMESKGGQVIKEVEIKATTKRDTENAVLLEQKKAMVIKESIGAVELSKKGVSDAAAATTKVSGVAKQEGSSNVYVRGLGDRYNSTTLNGLPLPSNDPSNKNIALDLFSTSMIQSVGVSKSFDASLIGDVSGANIDIKSKEFSGKPYFNIGMGIGANSQTTSKDFNTIDGTNRLGIADHTKHNVTDLTKLPFTDNFAPNKGKAPIASSFSLSGGKKFKFENESSLSLFLVGSFSNNYRARDGFSINILNKISDNNGNVTGFTKGSSYPEAKEFNYSNSKLTMGNLVFKVNSKNKISLNSLFVHSNSQKIQQYTGNIPDIADNDDELAYNILQTENQNKLLVNQLLSEHKIGETFDLNLGASYNLVNNDEPNRKKNIFKINTTDNTTQFASGTARYNSRYYHNLEEADINAMFSLVKYFGSRSENKGNFKVGYSFRNTNRDFGSTFFDYDFNSSSLVDIDNPDKVLNQQGLDSNIFRFQTGRGRGSEALNPFTYSALKTTHAPFAVVNYSLTDDFFVSAGIRYEKVDMNIEWDTNLSNSNGIPKELDNTYILPSLNLKYNFNDDNLLRLSASKTYTYPQFKEVAPFIYEGVNYSEYGNQELKPSENYNIDLKWEMFPKRGELISATVFGKMINNAINRIELNAASDNLFSFLNTGDSKVFGAEVELKKDLIALSNDDGLKQKLKIGFNATYMYNIQKFNKTTEFTPTNDKDPLEGAAPFLLNADITYSRKIDGKETNASLIFNYQDKKLYSVGTVNGLEGIYQKSIPMLDFVLKHKFTKKLGAKLSVKNILNPKIERYRDLPTSPITRSYQNGTNVSLGLNYKF